MIIIDYSPSDATEPHYVIRSAEIQSKLTDDLKEMRIKYKDSEELDRMYMDIKK